MASARATVERALRVFGLRATDVFAPGTQVVVGFSGGQDSTCLLHALAGLDLGLLAVYVDHALRPESAAESEQVLALAQRIGVRAEVVRVDVPSYRARQSLEQAARAARYQALGAIVRKSRARALLVAHTADDQAETVLLNLVRGTGLRGLGGMRNDDVIDPLQLGPPVPGLDDVPAALRVVRPLLRVGRTTTLAYCAELGLPCVTDPSNLSRAFTRNRVRLDLLPALERFNPAIREVLARTADLAGDDLAALEAIVEQLHAGLVRQPAPGALEYELLVWRAQPRALQRRLLRRGLETLLGNLVDVPSAPIDDALDLLRSSQAGQTYHLPYGVELSMSADTFTIHLHGRARPRTNAKNRGSFAPRV